MSTMFPAIEALDNKDIHGNEDMGHIHDEKLFEAHCELTRCAHDTDSLRQIHDTACNLERLHDTVNKYGVSNEVLSFVNYDGILGKVIPAIESIQNGGIGAALEAEETEEVKKGLIAKISEMTAAFFKKIWEVAAKCGVAIGNFCVAGYDKAISAAKWAGNKVYNAAKAVKEKVVAHPVASAIAALTALAAAAAVAYKLWDKSDDLPKSEVEGKHWEEVRINEVRTITKLVADVKEEDKKSGIASALGYTKEKFTALIDSIKNTFKEGGALSNLGKWFKDKASAAWKAVASKKPASNKEEDVKKDAEEKRAARRALDWLLAHTKSVWGWMTTHVSSIYTSVLSTFKGFFSKKEEGKPEENGAAAA